MNRATHASAQKSTETTKSLNFCFFI